MNNFELTETSRSAGTGSQQRELGLYEKPFLNQVGNGKGSLQLIVLDRWCMNDTGAPCRLRPGQGTAPCTIFY